MKKSGPSVVADLRRRRKAPFFSLSGFLKGKNVKIHVYTHARQTHRDGIKISLLASIGIMYCTVHIQVCAHTI